MQNEPIAKQHQHHSRCGSPRNHARTRATAIVAPRAAIRTILSAAAALLLAGAAVMAAPAAFAHDELIESTPAAGATVDTAPDAATLRFSNPLNTIPGSTVVQLADAAGTEIDAEPSVDGDTLTVDFGRGLPSGSYALQWRVVSSDGHPIEGTPANGGAIDFTVGAGGADESTSPAASSPAPSESAAAAPEEGATDPADAGSLGLGGLPAPLVWVILAAATIAAAAVVLAKVRRR